MEKFIGEEEGKCCGHYYSNTESMEAALPLIIPLVWVAEGVFNVAKGATHKVDEMTDSERLCARLSNEAYKANPKTISGYIPLSKDTFRKCPFDYVVFVNLAKRTVVVAFRGTTGARDIAVDILDIAVPTQEMARAHPLLHSFREVSNSLLSGGASRCAAKLLDDVLSEYEGYHVICTGHSLGGYLAAKAIKDQKSERAAGPHHVFNPGSGIGGSFLVYNDSRMHCHHIVGDVLSTSCGFHKKIYKCKESNPHKMANFL